MLGIRTRALVFATALTAAGAAAPAFAQNFTTRIETRPFYGAVVTLEEGVRVFRPLPADRQVIINPGGKTPLSLGFNETNVYEHRVIKNYNYGDASPAAYNNRGYYNYGYVPAYGLDNHGHKFRGNRPGGGEFNAGH